MRRLFLVVQSVAIMLFTAGVKPAHAQTQTHSKMLNTKHDLSANGPGPLKATRENQLCLFCHTPHVPQGYAAPQLWNHKQSTATYTLYSSDFLMNKNYGTPNQPNPASKLCLSCHDGTVALGAVYNYNGQTATIEMANNVTTMPSGAAGNLGTSLVKDHPVGYLYDPTKDPELVARAWPWQTPIKLDPDQSDGTVECHTCHDVHDNANGHFLRIANTNAAMCTFCHTKTGWPAAGHRTSIEPYLSPEGSSTTVGEWACRSCHTSHGGEGVPYLLRLNEESTCFTSGCHGSASPGTTAKDVETQTSKLYAHPVSTLAGKHKNPDTQSSLSVPNRHAECMDCHNSHQAQAGLHRLKTNTISSTLAGVSGIIPGSAGEWTQPTSYTTVASSTEENQICFKCHSYLALGFAPNGVTTTIGPSGVNITDQAMELNQLNHSAHPVNFSSNNRTGALVPKALAAGQLTADWSDAGNQTMYCSDCHGNDQAVSSTVPQGPHGSNSKFMLSGNAKYWPTNAFGALWSLDDIANNRNNWQNDMFCVNCHPMNTAGQFANNVHGSLNHQGADVKCITCHVTVPHGARRSRLIGYESDVSPYNYDGTGPYDKLVITGFQKASDPLSYLKPNCSMNGVCHGTQVGSYEP